MIAVGPSGSASQPQGITPAYLAESKAVEIYACISFPIPIMILSTSIRLWTEPYLHRNRLTIDDVLIVWATIISVGLNVVILQTPQYGYARHPEAVPQETLKHLGKVIYTAVHFYLVANACTKLSVLALYYRVFPSVTFRRISVATAIFTTLWLLTIELAWVTQCKPVWRSWDPLAPGKCTAVVPKMYYHASTNLALDLWIFILPLPLIAKLQMTTRRNKLLLACIFSVGLAACILGGVRVAFVNDMTSPKTAWEVVPFAITSGWGPLTKIPCANLPITYKPLASGFRRAMGFARAEQGQGGRCPDSRSPHSLSRSLSRMKRVLKWKRNMNMDANLAYSIRLTPFVGLKYAGSEHPYTGAGPTGADVGSSRRSLMPESELELETMDVGGALVERRFVHTVTTTDKDGTVDNYREDLRGHEHSVL
ncbi:hypothetical protein BDW74DRAFT_183698 [Aspergillus multicolor]|uniref:uncharacterized protein n=1 Tax=Aspergillus multicolor TaxID=41759 RepID=UPI003CCE0CF1